MGHRPSSFYRRGELGKPRLSLHSKEQRLCFSLSFFSIIVDGIADSAVQYVVSVDVVPFERGLVSCNHARVLSRIVKTSHRSCLLVSFVGLSIRFAVL